MQRGAGFGFAVLSAATFGTSGAFAASLLTSGWTPLAAVTVRVVVAALVLTAPALLLLRGRSRQPRRSARTLLVYGVAAVAGAQLCYFNAVDHLSVAVALLLEYSGALMVVAWLWLRHGQRPRRLTVGGAVLAVAGLALVLNLLGSGDVDAVASSGGSARPSASQPTSSSQRGRRTRCRPWSSPGAVSLPAESRSSAQEQSECCRLRRRATTPHCSTPRSAGCCPSSGCRLVAAVVSYVAGIVCARLLGAKVASFVGLTEVLFAVLFAWLLLGQVLRPGQLLGAVLVVAGIALVRGDELRGCGHTGTSASERRELLTTGGRAGR